MSFQIVLIISGNLSFLNYVTIIPFLACFDDDTSFGEFFHGRSLSAQNGRRRNRSRRAFNNTIAHRIVAPGRIFEHRASRQSHFRTANDEDIIRSASVSLTRTGAFGAVGKNVTRSFSEGNRRRHYYQRHQMEGIRIQSQTGNPGSAAAVHRPVSTAASIGKFGSPPLASPAEYPWTLHFVWKLLHNDPGTLSASGR